MDPKQFLELAQLLASGTRPAAYLRTATSRAYYAAYHVGFNVLSDMGVPAGKNHGDVWHRLQNSGDVDLANVGTKLSDLHSNRIKADYRLDVKPAEKQNNVRGHVALAKTIVETIERSCSGPKRPDIIKTIKAWVASLGS